MEATSLLLSSDPEHVSQPPSAVPHPREVSEEGPEPALPVQLTHHTSYMTLSTRGDDSESSRASGPSSYLLPNHGGVKTPLVFASDAQPGLEIDAASQVVDAPLSAGGDMVQYGGNGDTIMVDQSEVELHGHHVSKTNRSDTQSTMACVVGQAPVTFDPDSDMSCLSLVPHSADARQLCQLPTEVLLHILGYLDVSDLLATSRVCSSLSSFDTKTHVFFADKSKCLTAS
ncbi:hypothetical protein V8F33_004182 [Rhypophila sp. PSN 637]